MKLVLHHYWRSSASWRVRWALAVKGAAFESVIVDLAEGAQRSPEHLARNPNGYVPVLLVDGRPLAESVAILEWLEETIPAPALYPKEPFARARVRQLVEVVNAGIQPLQNLGVLRRCSPDATEQKRWAAEWNERGMRALEGLLEQTARDFGEGRFCLGDSLTAADLCLVPQVYSARRFGVDLAPFPRVLGAEAAALATPHADGARPERQPGAPAGAA
jgi:maleylacetoacetate isomerase